MPNATAHTITGIIVAYALYSFVFFPKNTFSGQYANQIFWLAIITTTILSAQLPDIDHHASRVAVWLTFISFAWILIFLYQHETIKIFYITIPMALLWGLRALKKITHRGICHNILFGSLFITLPILLWFGWQFYIFGAAISASHILLDNIVSMFKKEKRENKGGTTHERKRNTNDFNISIFAKHHSHS